MKRIAQLLVGLEAALRQKCVHDGQHDDEANAELNGISSGTSLAHEQGTSDGEGSGDHSGRLGFDAHGSEQLGHVFFRQCCQDTVSNARREYFRPLVHRLVGDADCLGGGGGRAPEQFNGFGFEHAPLNHSSWLFATLVQAVSVCFATMVDYKTRLQKAMGEMHPQVLADHLGVSLQSVRKVLAGQSAAFNVPNHFEACKFLKVDAGWLATGEGEMRTGQAWPFGAEIAPEQFFALDPGAIQSAVDVLASAAKRQSLMSKLGAPSPAQDARVGEFIAPAPRHELSSGFGDLAPASGPANYKKVTQIPASKHPMKKRGT